MPVLEHAQKTPETIAPESFEEVFRIYYPHVVRMVNRLGIDQQDSEDVAVAILTKFLEHDALADFDPDYGGRAAFKTFLNGFVRAYVQHHRTMQGKKIVREGVSLEMVVALGVDGEPQTWLDRYGDAYTENYEALMTWDLSRVVRSHLVRFVPNSPGDRCDLVAVFDAVVEQVEQTGKVDVMDLASRFGVGKTTAHNWMHRLRGALRDSLPTC